MSERRRQVLRLLAEGYSNEEIGRELYMAHETVKSNVRVILAELGARNRAHAVAIAYDSGILSAPVVYAESQ